MRPFTPTALARAAIAHTLFAPTTLGRAVARLGFVQADPIRAPARAQDLILWQRVKGYRAGAILEFVRERGEARPADVEAHFAHGRVTNAWGGQSRACTALLDAMHYRGLLRIAGRRNNVRVYAPASHATLELVIRSTCLDAQLPGG
jgi:uncharacterized protein YcaQ